MQIGIKFHYFLCRAGPFHIIDFGWGRKRQSAESSCLASARRQRLRLIRVEEKALQGIDWGARQQLELRLLEYEEELKTKISTRWQSKLITLGKALRARMAEDQKRLNYRFKRFKTRRSSHFSLSFLSPRLGGRRRRASQFNLLVASSVSRWVQFKLQIFWLHAARLLCEVCRFTSAIERRCGSIWGRGCRWSVRVNTFCLCLWLDSTA